MWIKLNQKFKYSLIVISYMSSLAISTRLGSKVQIYGNQLDSFEANWILELDLVLDYSFCLGSSNHELSLLALPFSSFFGCKLIYFSFKIVPCKFILNLPLFGLGISSKGRGSNLWLSYDRIALFHWTLNFGPSFNVALIILYIKCWTFPLKKKSIVDEL